MTVTLLILAFSLLANAQTTAFTYQGSLKNAGTNANGNYDFEFALFDALSSGTQASCQLITIFCQKSRSGYRGKRDQCRERR